MSDVTYEKPRERDVGLGPSQQRALRALIEAVFARKAGDGVAPPPEPRITWVCNEIDDFLSRVTTRSRLVVLLSLFAVSVIAPLLARRFGGLASLALDDRIHALELFEKSPLAPALLAVKALVSLHYYEHPDAAREVGFDGACLLEAGR